MPLDSKRQRLADLHTDRLIAAGIADRILHDRADRPPAFDDCQFWVETQPAWDKFPARTVVLIAYPTPRFPVMQTISFWVEPDKWFGAADRLPLTVAQQTLVDELMKDSV